MNTIARKFSSIFKATSYSMNAVIQANRQPQQFQQSRGIRVRVIDGNLEQALTFLQRKMQQSGMERLIKNVDTRHIKNSEKRVLARKNLMRRLQSQDYARKLQAVLMKKVRGL